MAQLPVALQLYTVRDDLAADYVGTLRRVAEMGYTAIELGSTDALVLPDLPAVLADLGLRAVAMHIGFEECEGDPSAALAAARALGCGYTICSSIPEERRGDAAAYRAVGAVLTQAGATAREYGLRFAYHNHAFEFAPLEDRHAFDILMDAADPALVASEFDVYWASYGQVDPVAYIRTLGRRCRLIHLKDMAPDADRSFAEVGEGILDLASIIAAGQEVGAEWYIVEQDISTIRPPLEAARLSLQNMRARGWA